MQTKYFASLTSQTVQVIKGDSFAVINPDNGENVGGNMNATPDEVREAMAVYAAKVARN